MLGQIGLRALAVLVSMKGKMYYLSKLQDITKGEQSNLTLQDDPNLKNCIFRQRKTDVIAENEKQKSKKRSIKPRFKF